MLAKQRSRISTIDSHSEFERTSEVDDPLGTIDKAEFADALTAFKPKTDFEMNLLLGVLQRYGKVPESVA